MKKISLFLVILTLLFAACRRDDIFVQPETEKHGEAQHTDIKGFYLLNEGNMGSNKASLDYYDYATATYTRNIYQAANPNVAQSLGDVGNDLQIYGSRLYAVINCSNFIEVMDAATAKHIGSLQVPNCRYLCFRDGYGYITSYAGPVRIDPDYKQIGYVLKFDTATLQPVDTCYVGFQPDGLAIAGNTLYVANSGGYRVPNYENTLSVIDLHSFRETKRIEVAVNLQYVLADPYGQLWVSSRGDYYDTPSYLYCLDSKTHTVTDTIKTAVSGMCLCGDSLFIYGSEFSYLTMQQENTYAIVNIKTRQIVSRQIITDGTETDIDKPYGIRVHPLTREIYLTDAKNYVTPGRLHCYSPDGKRLWSVRTGDIPSKIIFH